jgi:cytoskeletal protein RodZ
MDKLIDATQFLLVIAVIWGIWGVPVWVSHFYKKIQANRRKRADEVQRLASGRDAQHAAPPHGESQPKAPGSSP